MFWIKCSQLDLKHELDNNYEEFCVADFHKATVEELIEHFKRNSMETIYDAGRRVFEAARWDTLQVGNTDDCIEMFEAGVQFAALDYQVEEELPEIGCTVFVKKLRKEGDTWVQHIYSVSTRLAPSGEWESIKWSDVGFTRGIVTHWRPIELKII